MHGARNMSQLRLKTSIVSARVTLNAARYCWNAPASADTLLTRGLQRCTLPLGSNAVGFILDGCVRCRALTKLDV